MSRKNWIIAFIVGGCVFIAFVDGSKMDYVSKALFKITVFTSIPLIYSTWFGKQSLKSLFRFKLKSCRVALLVGAVLYGLIMILYLSLGSIFDLSKVSAILDHSFISGTLLFLPVAFYIAVINSFLEEFFFRGFAYLILKKESSESFAFWFSAISFSLYHLFLMAGLFDVTLYVIAIILLVFAGGIFNLLDKKSETLFPSWLLHGFANMGLNTIAIILLKMF
jgi:uncharacterized protein